LLPSFILPCFLTSFSDFPCNYLVLQYWSIHQRSQHLTKSNKTKIPFPFVCLGNKWSSNSKLCKLMVCQVKLRGFWVSMTIQDKVHLGFQQWPLIFIILSL
jgi:hypothetical protein